MEKIDQNRDLIEEVQGSEMDVQLKVKLLVAFYEWNDQLIQIYNGEDDG